MTPALKAMVEAMGREFLRQTEESDEAPVCQFEAQTLRVTDVYGGSFDLEKVARAGLLAIREPGDEVWDGVEAADVAADPFIGTEDEGVPADPADGADHWRFAINAILGEKP